MSSNKPHENTYYRLLANQVPQAENAKPEPNPKQRYGDAKVKLQLVPPAAMICMARGLAEGAEKYGAWNWRDQPVEVMTYIGAIQRHLAALVEGEQLDPDGAGKTHLDGIAANIAILCDVFTAGRFIDNRPRIHNRGALNELQAGSRRFLEDAEKNA